MGMAFQEEGAQSPTSTPTPGDSTLLPATAANTTGVPGTDGEVDGRSSKVQHHEAAAASVQALCKVRDCMQWFDFDCPLLIHFIRTELWVISPKGKTQGKYLRKMSGSACPCFVMAIDQENLVKSQG